VIPRIASATLFRRRVLIVNFRTERKETGRMCTTDRVSESGLQIEFSKQYKARNKDYCDPAVVLFSC
jgi:hypothetical protein